MTITGQTNRANGTILNSKTLDAKLIVIDVSEDSAQVWSELRPALVANVLRGIADDLDEIADL